MSKEKALLKVILANTNAIMEHFKITLPKAPEKHADNGQKAATVKKTAPKKNEPANKKKG